MSGPIRIVKTKLFIGNLDPGTQQDELRDLFSSFGTVLEASVIKDYGFVHFGSIEEAEKAAIALNNKEFHGKRLRVELSTSTVRHRPGQPEPASALRHSRTRGTIKGNNNNNTNTNNGLHRYNASGLAGGAGPIRHNSSGWARNDIHPYDSVRIDHDLYDRARPYNVRPDPRRYYEDVARDSGYGPGYDTSSYSSSIPSGPSAAHPYHDLPPPYSRPDPYGSSRPYDRHMSTPPIDPYYGSAVSQGPPPTGDPYNTYDPYEKYYASRARDPEFPDQRNYNVYSNYRNDPYAAGSSSSSSRHSSLRHDLPVGLQPPQEVYPPPHRQHQSYASGPYNATQYYGAQPR